MSNSSPRRSRDDSGDWKHLLSVGGLLGAIALVLLLGAILRTEESSDGGSESISTEIPIERQAAVPREASTLAGDAHPVVPAERDPLATRVTEDLQRIDRDHWTRQLAAVCEPDNVRRWVADHGGRDELYILPVTIGERACFRVCWGDWSTAGAARRARLPAAVVARAGGEGRVVAAAEITR